MIITAFDMGQEPKAIAQSFPSATLADIYAVSAYYLQNKVEFDAYLQEEEEAANRLQAFIQKQWPNDGLKERLLARRQQADQMSDPSRG
jgi:hypothetical protein